ncbi:hypothetical protein CHS0354_002041 [Potamilus streckersoni]|uniref:Succinate--CoA ligase [ADP-forming] subunit beta, mitochondrial n=1 Tax=Potamilus streckersoni TaxID=2493646 RepID=A0AAE0T674_9BIVA|nr:hypothetical protein CHS0354_002041 [Potamilus streckersoni]
MKIHEYQGKEVIARFGAAVPLGYTAKSAEEAALQAARIPGDIKVGGGVKVCKTPDELKQHAARILANPLITPQTSAEGQRVKTLLIEQGTVIKKELYFSVLVDRESKKPMILASAEGGMDIEEVSEKHPDKIIQETVDPLLGLRNFQALRIAYRMGLDAIDPKLPAKAAKCFMSLYRAFSENDCALLEINPMIINGDNEVVCLDCKMSFDENALYRHPDIEKYRDLDEENAVETEAAKWNLNFIKLDGNIGCMVNGAGLAMATMDIIKYYGGEPANFLDVGGGATAERVEAAFKIITEDPNVKAIFINIFGGIVRCDMIAEGIIEAFKKVNLRVPVVVRLQGNNADKAKTIINGSELKDKLVMIDDITEAAKKSVAFVKG